MTADERIEKLLNEFGQTISDLPTANDYKLRHDQIPNLIAAMDTAEAWYDPESNEKIAYSMMAYICHLVEIIDRMEWALSNAKVRWDDLKQKLQFHKTENAEFDLLNNYMRNDIYALGYREACGDILDLMNNESPDSLEKGNYCDG